MRRLGIHDLQIHYRSLAKDLLTPLFVATFTIFLFICYQLFRLRGDWGHPSLYSLDLLAIFIICLATSRVSYATVPAPTVTLARGVAIATGIYNLTLFPGIPVVHDVFFGMSQLIILLAWFAAGVGAVLSLWRPSWLIFCGFYTYWIKRSAGYVTGLDYHTLLEVQPLYQVPAYLGLAVVGLLLLKRSRIGGVMHFFDPTSRHQAFDPWTVVFITAIALHAAAYFYSGIAKASLDGGLTDWMLNNENRNLLFVAAHQKQLLWSEWQALKSAAIGIMTFADVGRPLAIAILFGQLASLIAFSNRRLLALLFTFYDIMHVGIFVLAGANFWTWFMLNLAIVAAAVRLPLGVLNWKTGIYGAIIILLSINFTKIRWLGWYDTAATNHAYFEVAYPGGRTRIPATAFGFYSYPIAHMSFGFPPGNYFPTSTNGGTRSSAIRRQSVNCAFESSNSPFEKRWNPDAVTAFIRGYHGYILDRLDADGRWSNDFYPHHFWAAPSVVQHFASIDMRKVTDYILVVESVCLDENGAIIRSPYLNEFSIHVGQR